MEEGTGVELIPREGWRGDGPGRKCSCITISQSKLSVGTIGLRQMESRNLGLNVALLPPVNVVSSSLVIFKPFSHSGEEKGSNFSSSVFGYYVQAVNMQSLKSFL